jgi:hypothetical protein
MKTAQIKFDDKTFKYLEKESELLKKSISDIVNDTVRESMQNHKDRILQNLDNVFGILKDSNTDVDTYINDLRKDRSI